MGGCVVVAALAEVGATWSRLIFGVVYVYVKSEDDVVWRGRWINDINKNRVTIENFVSPFLEAFLCSKIIT